MTVTIDGFILKAEFLEREFPNAPNVRIIPKNGFSTGVVRTINEWGKNNEKRDISFSGYFWGGTLNGCTLRFPSPDEVILSVDFISHDDE